MDTKTVLETYKRYLKTLKDWDSDLFRNYGRIKHFIDTNCNDDELRALIYRHCIGKNIQEIRHRNFKIKDNCEEGWSSAATMEGYRLLGNLKKHEDDYDLTTFAINFRRFAELADSQNSHVELYLWYCYCNRIGDRLFRVSMEEIEEAAANAIKAENDTPTETE